MTIVQPASEKAGKCGKRRAKARHVTEPSPTMATAAVAETIKLVIWDLDETFWDGTLEEGGVTLIADNLEIVRTLSRRGIVNSIASKNHFGRAKQVLEQADIWDEFVLPQIAFLPKGELVRSVIETCQLRAPSVLFIDDNTINLNEVMHYNPGIQVTLPDILPRLLEDARCRGASDPTLSRLQKYKIIEQREAERAHHASDNTEFLRQSNIRLSIHHDVIGAFDRVHELVNRTNQLNFTKQRLSPDVETARLAMQELLTRQFNCHAAYIKVADKYGYYGICGFYLLRGAKLEHLLFSCRILNMGIEQLIYQKIGRPGLPKSEGVVSDPAASIRADWITVVDDAEAPEPLAVAAAQQGTICLRGACELSQTAHYLRERHVVNEEFPFPHGPWAIVTPLTDYVALQPAFDQGDCQDVFDWPWFDAEVMRGNIFTRSADIYVLSFGQEPSVFRYRHKATGLVVPINLGPFNTRDLTRLSYADASARLDLKLTQQQWARMQAEFECLWRFDARVFEQNLRALLDKIADKRIIILLANTKFGPYEVQKEMHEGVNEIIRQVALPRGITLIALDDVVRSDSEMLEMNHFRREVYMRLADVIGEELSKASPVAAAAMDYKPLKLPRRNLLPAHDSFTGRYWRADHAVEVSPSSLRPRFRGAAVLCHRLARANDQSTSLVFGCRLINTLVPGEYYTASAWVWIPHGFGGREVSICCAGRPSINIRRASTSLHDVWQHVWVSIRLPLDVMSLLVALRVIGEAGDEVHATGWKLEAGRAPTDYVPKGV